MVKITIINELRMYNLPKHTKSIASAISGLLNFADDQINRNKSVDQISVVQKSVIEKLANNPCKSLPNVAGQDTIRSFQAELSNQNSLARAQRLNLVLLHSGDNKTNIKVPVVSQPV